MSENVNFKDSRYELTFDLQSVTKYYGNFTKSV